MARTPRILEDEDGIEGPFERVLADAHAASLGKLVLGELQVRPGQASASLRQTFSETDSLTPGELDRCLRRLRRRGLVQYARGTGWSAVRDAGTTQARAAGKAAQ